MREKTRSTTAAATGKFPACFRPRATHSPARATLTTSLYNTRLGLFSLSWSRRHLTLHHHHRLVTISLSSFPFFFPNRGHKKLPLPGRHQPAFIIWDLTRARPGPGPGPEPTSGFYLAVVSAGEIALLIGDSDKEAYARTKAKPPRNVQSLVIRREHVYGQRFYTTRADFNGESKEISIEFNPSCEDPFLCIRFDQKRILMVKHLKWKFRGSERVEFEGQKVQISWDAHNWMFEGSDSEDGYALFTFRFEDLSVETESWGRERVGDLGLEFEREKMGRKKRVKRGRSASSAGCSSVSSSAGSSSVSSVMEWESVEENELKGPTGFSLLVYVWKRSE